MMSDYKVDTVNDDLHMFYVTFHGPTDSNPSKKNSLILFLSTFLISYLSIE